MILRESLKRAIKCPCAMMISKINLSSGDALPENSSLNLSHSSFHIYNIQTVRKAVCRRRNSQLVWWQGHSILEAPFDCSQQKDR